MNVEIKTSDKRDSQHVWLTATVAGTTVTVARRNVEEMDSVDPYLFDEDYTIAGSTGFLLWESSRVVVSLLEGRLGELLQGKRVVELGSGIGLAGLCAAAAGAHMLLTDLPSVHSGILLNNVKTNCERLKSPAEGHDHLGWEGCQRLGHGSATTMALDWTKPLEQQVASNDPRTADAVLAVDTVWLKDILAPYVAVVTSILNSAPGKVCYMAFVERGKGSASNSFCTAKDVFDSFQAAGCRVNRFHQQEIEQDGKTILVMVLCIQT